MKISTNSYTLTPYKDNDGFYIAALSKSSGNMLNLSMVIEPK